MFLYKKLNKNGNYNDVVNNNIECDKENKIDNNCKNDHHIDKYNN